MKPYSEATPTRLRLGEMAHLGAALGRVGSKVTFVYFGIPGEEVIVSPFRNRSKWDQAKVLEVVDPSPLRVSPVCPYFGECGGCQWQHIDYQAQIELKQQVVKQQITRIGRLDDVDVSPTIPSDAVWHYRNHSRFTSRADGRVGFTGLRSHWVVPIDFCHISDPAINRLLEVLQGRCSSVKHQLVVRVGVGTGDTLVYPHLDLEGVVSGQPFLEETVLGRRFRVSAHSFFQVNTQQAETLARLVKNCLSLTGSEVVVDAYSGVGTFAVLLAPSASKIIAIEEAGPAVADARHNAAGLDNVVFMLGKAEALLPTIRETVHSVVLDPPRAGCQPSVLKAIIDKKIERLVYVSCDPATLARDLRILVDGGYDICKVQPMDMFPHTYHVETVVLMQRAESR
jgi:23S rRNA (uracil1939-C5)-methyltransferase